MNPEEQMMQGGQPQMEDMSPDESAAALALATEMSEGMMPQAPIEETTEAPVEESTKSEDETGEEELESEDIAEIKKEIASIREEIAKVSKEEPETKEEPKESNDIQELKTMFQDFIKQSNERNKEMDGFRADLKSILNDK